MHVAKITGHEIGHDLAVSLCGEFVPADKSFQHQVNRCGLLVLRRQIGMGRNVSYVPDNGIEQPLILGPQRGVTFKLSDKRIVHRRDPSCPQTCVIAVKCESYIARTYRVPI